MEAGQQGGGPVLYIGTRVTILTLQTTTHTTHRLVSSDVTVDVVLCVRLHTRTTRRASTAGLLRASSCCCCLGDDRGDGRLQGFV